jgi:transposase
MARELVGDVRAVEVRLKRVTTLIADTVAEHGTTLTRIDGVGPVVAGRLLGRTGRAARFANPSAFANYAGVAPVEVAGGGRVRHRLPCGGDRQLNHALHIVALTQARMRTSAGRVYYARSTKARPTTTRCAV